MYDFFFVAYYFMFWKEMPIGIQTVYSHSLVPLFNSSTQPTFKNFV